MSERKPLDGSVEVLTFKEGLLSRVAHDLCLRVGEVELLADDTSVEARFACSSLRVLHAVREGAPDTQALSEKDRAQVEENIRDKVLQSKKFPEAIFKGAVENQANEYRIAGQLSLHGQSHPVEVRANREGGRIRGQVEIQPSRWGIVPFKAMLGAIKLQDRVIVRFDFAAA